MNTPNSEELGSHSESCFSVPLPSDALFDRGVNPTLQWLDVPDQEPRPVLPYMSDVPAAFRRQRPMSHQEKAGSGPSDLTRHRLVFAAAWASACGELTPASLRAAVNKRVPNRAISDQMFRHL